MGLSVFLYEFSCRLSIRCRSPDLFVLGSGRPLERMVVATLSAAFLAVSPLMESCFENVPFLHSSMKAHRIRVLLMGEYSSR